MKYQKQGGATGSKSKPHKAPPVDKRRKEITEKKRRTQLRPQVITIGKENLPETKNSASKYRTYIHVAAPEFRAEAARQIRSLLLASAPRLKIPHISTKGNQGLLVDASLRDIYVLAHGLRCADDIMIQLGRPQHKVGSFNRFIQHLAKLPIHAFAPRIVPKQTAHRVGKQSKAQTEHDELLKKLSELPLLHHNVRILTNRSILSNQKTLKQFTVETIKRLLTLRRGQSLKRRNVKYTDNPALFGKAEDEVEQALIQQAEERYLNHQQYLHHKQAKLLESNQKRQKHIQNLFGTSTRMGDTQNSSSGSGGMGQGRFGAKNVKSLQNTGMSNNLDDNEQDALYDHGGDVDNDELRAFVAKRTAHFQKLGIEYDPTQDPAVQDFLDSQAAFDDEISESEHGEFSGEEGTIDDGMAVNYNDYIGPDGQLDRDAFNAALNKLLKSQGLSVDDLDDSTMNTVLDKVEDQVALNKKQQEMEASGEEFEEPTQEAGIINAKFQSQNKKDQVGTTAQKAVQTDTKPPQSDSKRKLHKFQANLIDDFSDDDEFSEMAESLDSILKTGEKSLNSPEINEFNDFSALLKATSTFGEERIQEATVLAEKLSFLKQEVKKQAVLRSDFNTLRRLQIDEENERKEQQIFDDIQKGKAQNAAGDVTVDVFSPNVRKALDILQDHEDQIKDIQFISRLHNSAEDEQFYEKVDNSQKQAALSHEYSDSEDFDDLDDSQVFKLPPNKHNMVVDRLMGIQTKLQQETDSDFYIQTLAKYGESAAPGGADSITDVFKRYKAQFPSQSSTSSTPFSQSPQSADYIGPIKMMKQHNVHHTSQTNQTRLREREPLQQQTTTSARPPTSTQTSLPYDATVPSGQTSPHRHGDEDGDAEEDGEEAKLQKILADSDVELPSDYTEGEGVDAHHRSQRSTRGFKAVSPALIRRDGQKKKQVLYGKDGKKLADVDVSSTVLEIDENLSPMEQLDLALERIADGIQNQKQPKTHITLPDGTHKRLLTPSLLAVAWSNVGKRGTTASKRILATAKMSAPTIYTFLPPEYRGLSKKKLQRRAIYDMYLREHLQRAETKVFSMTQRLKKKDAKVRNDLRAAAELSPEQQPALMIPFRPHSDIPHSCMTISLKHNTMRVSISAIGARHQALYKRGYRTHLIETSLRESITNGVLGVAYDVMSPISPDSPLYKLETENSYLQPIRSSLLYLAKDVRIGYNPEELKELKWSPEQEYLQQKFLENAVTILGEEQTQQQLLSALLETRRNVLSNPGVLQEVMNNGKAPADKRGKKGKKNKALQPLTTNLIDDVIEKMNDDQFDDLVGQLTLKTGSVPLDERGDPLPLRPTALITPRIENSSQSPDASSTTPTDPADTPQSSTQHHHIKPHSTSPTDQSSSLIPTSPGVPKPTSKKDIVNSFKLKSTDVMNAIANIPVYFQAQAAASLAAGLPFDKVAPLPSPTITGIRTIAVHNRDHTPLSEVLSHTLSSGVLDADPSIRVFDPFCGSGTIVIESVFRFLGLPLQPLQRPFAFENWPIHDEYQYNAMMWEWKNRYQDILKDFVKTFGISKYQTLTGEFQSIDGRPFGDTQLEFPLFVGTDLRHKSIRASIHNANTAGVNYFTHFFQTDFQNVIYEANKLWRESEEDRLALAAEMEKKKTININTNDALGDDFFAQFAGSPDMNPGHQDRGALNNSSSSVSSALRPKKALLSLDEVLGNGISGEATIPMNNQTRRSQNILNNPRMEPLPLTKPYLKGYTMFSNIPWGVIDEKPDYKPNPWATEKGNITYNEPVEDLYVRLGRTLQDNRDLFRDVFVLSAHQKFDKLTNIGAQRQARENERKFGAPSLTALLTKDTGKNQQPGLIHSQRGVTIYEQPKQNNEGVLQWDTVSTFYNNGVKTHLLKLKM